MSIIHSKTKLRPRHKTDFYPTPLGLCRAGMELLSSKIDTGEKPPVILDPGAGTGNWGRAVKEVYPDSKLIGVELNDEFAITADYDAWMTEDFLTCDFNTTMVVGNPPFSLAQEFIEHGLDCLLDGGIMMYLLRVAYLNTQGRYKDLWTVTPPAEVVISSRRPSFTGDGKTDDTDYALYIWSKGWKGATRLNWLMWEYANEDKNRN